MNGLALRSGTEIYGVLAAAAIYEDAMRHRFFRPEFVYRPQQLLRAAWQKISGDPNSYIMTRLPWGAEISVHPGDYIGHRVLRHGLTALDACEAVFRLMQVGGTALDIGANHGVVTSAMRHKGGPNCRIHSFEMVRELSQN